MEKKMEAWGHVGSYVLQAVSLLHPQLDGGMDCNLAYQGWPACRCNRDSPIWVLGFGSGV